MKKNRLKERIFIICFGVLLICIALYAYKKTYAKQKVLKEGILKTAIVSRTTTKGTNKSIYVRINNEQYFAGEAFGQYNRTIEGDSINVFYLTGIDYVVLEGKKSFLSTIIFEYIIVLIGFSLIVGSFIYIKKKKILTQIHAIPLNTRINKATIQEVIDSFLPNNDVLYKLNKEDIDLVKRNIKMVFDINPQLLINHLTKLLLAKDYKAGTIYDAIIECKCLTDKQFIEELKKIISFYNETKAANCLDAIKVFLMSEQAENIELHDKIENLIDKSSFMKPDIRKELKVLLQ